MKRATSVITANGSAITDFNPRPREEGDHQRGITVLQSTHFNPRPREEGDFYCFCTCKGFLNFNPRPREEGDAMAILCLFLRSNFNPRPREEGDLRLLSTNLLTIAISIHALVKRATGYKFKRGCNTMHFNPRPREEGDGK